MVTRSPAFEERKAFEELPNTDFDFETPQPSEAPTHVSCFDHSVTQSLAVACSRKQALAAC